MSALTASLAGLLAFWGSVEGNGKVVEQSRPVPELHGISIAGGIRARVTVGSKSSATLVADDNLLPLIVSEVNDGVLSVHAESGHSLKPSKPIELRVVVARLDVARLSGGTSLEGVINAAPTLTLDTSGGAVVKLTGVATDSLNIDSSGGGELHLAGRAKNANVSLSGGVQFDATTLQLDNLKLDASGGVDGSARVSGDVTGQISGGVSFKLAGKPTHVAVARSGGARLTTE